ncbi:MAG TPA: xanthine dehydrogenase family protein molybdopterin-binding subunit [Bryobacteraceae bacterium]|nr:xanthine dehydrogenase family protein molybdopterin-binding subunit [Bryobacteraceae bacterium]
MANLPDYHWPPMGKRRVMGKPMNRLDGIAKSSGAAKYNSDVKPEGMLFGALLTSPHAHAKVKAIDTSAAQKLNGVEAVRVVANPGTEVQWAGAEIAFVAARTEEIANDAIRLIKVDYEVLPHLVSEEDLSKTGNRARAVGEQVTGDPEKAFKEADAVSEGHYGIPVLTHCCLEPHGQTIAVKGDHIEYFPSTQNVYGIATDIGRALNIPVSNVHVHMDYMGGGFGSKFPADVWGVEAAKMSQSSGGKPVKMFLDRATELSIAGNRPSIFANVKTAAKRDGTITAWESQTWSTGGIGGGNVNGQLFPYVFNKVPNRRVNHTAVSVNAGGARAWRAPIHPQVCFVTCSALEDLAAKLNMDPLEMFVKNLNYTARADLYKFQFDKAAELMEWKKNWHPRGDSGSGPVKRGLGLALGTWGGAGHFSTCKTTIHPDASVEVELATQDLGTGSRTMVAMIAAETFGLPVSAIKVKIGDNSYPNSGGSGGSTTSGGITSSTRKSSMNALQKLFEVVAQSLNVTADELEAVDGRIRVKGNPDRGMSFQQAAQKLGVNSISEMGENNPRQAPQEGLNTGGTGGVQMADVSVDTETGIVKMNRIVAVQDCGLVVNPKTAESQVFGACIMSVCGALYEERIMDQQTGRVLNPDMEFYKLAGIGDIGEIIVHMDIREENDRRGVIGLGEPCAIGGLAAIANAVANAIGVRVPRVPLTPARVLAALERRTA